MKIFSEYGKIDFNSPRGRGRVFAALQYFATERPKAMAKKYKEALQGFGASRDFPAAAYPILEKFHATPSYDAGFEEIFDIMDRTGTTESGYDILDVEDGLAFDKVPVGGKLHIYKMAGTKVSVDFEMYGGGLGWHRTLIDDKKYWTLEDNAVAFVNKFAEDKSAHFYALIEALAAGYNIAWQAPDPSGLATTVETYTANRDAQTLNAAAQAILLAVKDKGYGVTLQNVTFKVSTPIQIVGRLTKALGLLLQGFAGSPGQISYKFELMPTMMYSTTTAYYVILPKHKLKGGNRMNLTIFSKFDEESYTDIAVGWGRYAGAIGDSDQLRRCAISGG